MPEELPKPEQEREGVTDAQQERIEFLMRKFNLNPDLTESFYKNVAPKICEIDFECVEITESEDLTVTLETTFYLSDDEVQVDTYNYKPDEKLVECQSTLTNVSEEINDLTVQCGDMSDDFDTKNDMAQDTYDAIMDVVEEIDEYTEEVVEYRNLDYSITNWRGIMFDTDQETNEFQRALDKTREENNLKITDLLIRASVRYPVIDDLMESYRNANLEAELQHTKWGELVGQIEQLKNIRQTDFVTVDPQKFIDILEMLSDAY